ncbi:uncharacterized protein LOC130355960 isoform X2 [Hyla sarda]|uniref:uncharacterized protein LOC130355960 isoform X2 n=1 Tax=Hyla sarda TaxID=327740 RepID=UPI0024C3E976|nr:uncharacterized protein LOC130355960 isoform X2 [Hyla sarda]
MDPARVPLPDNPDLTSIMALQSQQLAQQAQQLNQLSAMMQQLLSAQQQPQQPQPPPAPVLPLAPAVVSGSKLCMCMRRSQHCYNIKYIISIQNDCCLRFFLSISITACQEDKQCQKYALNIQCLFYHPVLQSSESDTGILGYTVVVYLVMTILGVGVAHIEYKFMVIRYALYNLPEDPLYYSIDHLHWNSNKCSIFYRAEIRRITHQKCNCYAFGRRSKSLEIQVWQRTSNVPE